MKSCGVSERFQCDTPGVSEELQALQTIYVRVLEMVSGSLMRVQGVQRGLRGFQDALEAYQSTSEDFIVFQLSFREISKGLWGYKGVSKRFKATQCVSGDFRCVP